LDVVLESLEFALKVCARDLWIGLIHYLLPPL